VLSWEVCTSEGCSRSYSPAFHLATIPHKWFPRCVVQKSVVQRSILRMQSVVECLAVETLSTF
jgi:hypothetical protein